MAQCTSSLLQLPGELLDDIIQATIPEGLGSLARTCHTFHHLCKPFLEHHNFLQTHYHDFCNNRYPPNTPTLRFNPGAYDLILHISQEPIIARYIVHADFTCDTWPPKPRPNAFLPDMADGGPFVALFANSPALHKAGLDWREYYTMIEEELYDTDRYKFSQHAAEFVLTLLPNLNPATLKLPRHWESSGRSDKLLRAIFSPEAVEDIAQRNIQSPIPRRSARGWCS